MPSENPYLPPDEFSESAKGQVKEAFGESIWARNAVAITVVLIMHLITMLTLTNVLNLPLESSLVPLFCLGAIASAWANLPVSFRVGITQGGIPVFFVVYFTALTIHGMSAMTVGEFMRGLFLKR